jgi:uncharacterized protein YjbI with pentapeptide repeats
MSNNTINCQFRNADLSDTEVGGAKFAKAKLSRAQLPEQWSRTGNVAYSKREVEHDCRRQG